MECVRGSTIAATASKQPMRLNRARKLSGSEGDDQMANNRIVKAGIAGLLFLNVRRN